MRLLTTTVKTMLHRKAQG